MDKTEKTRENRLRRMAARQLHRLEKSRRRDQHAVDFGGFMLVDHRNIIVLGAGRHEYDATLNEIEAYLTDTSRPRYKKASDGKYRWHVPHAGSRVAQ
jgi:hypothetical protein